MTDTIFTVVLATVGLAQARPNYSSLTCMIVSYFVYIITYINMQCRNYSEGLITGSVCSPLCDTRDIEFEKCLGHGIKLHVLRAKWRGKPVILKTSKPLGTRSLGKLSFLFSKPLNHNFKITRQEFMAFVSYFVFKDWKVNSNNSLHKSSIIIYHRIPQLRPPRL